jgi:hypothetical protein
MGAIDLIALIVQWASGVVGGNVAGSLFRSLSLGVLGNSLAGLIGGGIGSQLVNANLRLAATPAVADGPDVGTLIAQASAAVIGGVILALLVGLLTRFGR